MMTENEIQKAIETILYKYIDRSTTAVFLFGSRAGGFGDSTADYDIGLFRGQPIDGATLAHIKADMEESHIPVPVDIVDFASLPEDFKQIALQKTQIWNQPKNGIKIS